MPSARPVPWPMILRQTHNLLGMLIAPSILMFAVTGGFQIFRLNESRGGYTPPPLLEKMARVHKAQVFNTPTRRPDTADKAKPVQGTAAASPTPERKERARPAPTLSKILLQWFFVLVSVGLFVSTLVGIWLGATMGRYKVAARWMLAAGTVIPVVILLIP